MTFTMKVSLPEANEVRTALVERTRFLKQASQMKLATEQERFEMLRSVNTLETILRRDFGDYEAKETAPTA